MNLTHETSFAVFPQDCNYHPPMIFGGKMLAEMDRCAATTVRRFLYDSPKGAKHALTVGVNNMTFHKGAEVGDLIFLTGTVKEVGQKRIVVNVVAEKEGDESITEPKIDIKYSHDLDTGMLHKDVSYGYVKSKKLVRSKMAEGDFAFCAYDMNKKRSMEHGITLPEIK